MPNERINKRYTFLLLIIMGTILVFVRLVLMLLPASFLFDALLYGLAGYILGKHVYYGRWRWGFVLALPAMIAILYFIFSATNAATETDMGLKNILDFLLIPASACAGIWLKNHKIIQHHNAARIFCFRLA